MRYGMQQSQTDIVINHKATEISIRNKKKQWHPNLLYRSWIGATITE